MPVITSHTISLLTPHIIDLVKTVYNFRNKDKNNKDLKGTSQEQAVDILNRDVSELQEIATAHGAAISEIAQKVEQRLSGLERQLKRQRLFTLAATVIAVIAVGIALVR